MDAQEKIKELEIENAILREQVELWKKRYYAVIRGDNGG
jgi:hypothetical protein